MKFFGPLRFLISCVDIYFPEAIRLSSRVKKRERAVRDTTKASDFKIRSSQHSRVQFKAAELNRETYHLHELSPISSSLLAFVLVEARTNPQLYPQSALSTRTVIPSRTAALQTSTPDPSKPSRMIMPRVVDHLWQKFPVSINPSGRSLIAATTSRKAIPDSSLKTCFVHDFKHHDRLDSPDRQVYFSDHSTSRARTGRLKDFEAPLCRSVYVPDPGLSL